MFDFNKPFPCYVQKKWMAYGERVRIRSLFRLSLRVLLRSGNITAIVELQKGISDIVQAVVDETYLMNDEDLTKEALDAIKPRAITLVDSELPPLENDDYGLLRILAFLSCTMNDRAISPPLNERLLSIDLRGQSLPFSAYRYILSTVENYYEKLLRTLVVRRLLYAEWLLSLGLLYNNYSQIENQTPSSHILNFILKRSFFWMQQRWQKLKKTLSLLPEYVVSQDSFCKLNSMGEQPIKNGVELVRLKGTDIIEVDKKRYDFRYYPELEDNILRNSDRLLVDYVIDGSAELHIFNNLMQISSENALNLVNSHLMASLVALELELMMETEIKRNVQITIDISIDSDMLRDGCEDYAVLLAVVHRQCYVSRFPYEVGIIKLKFGGVKISEIREAAIHPLVNAIARLEDIYTPKAQCLQRLSVDSESIFTFGVPRFRHLGAVCIKIPLTLSNDASVNRLARAFAELPTLHSICLHGFRLQNRMAEVFDHLGTRKLNLVGFTDCLLADSDFDYMLKSQLFSVVSCLTLCECHYSVTVKLLSLMSAFCDSLECLSVKDCNADFGKMDLLSMFEERLLSMKRLKLLRAHFRSQLSPDSMLHFLKTIARHQSLMDVEVDEPFDMHVDAASLFATRCKYDCTVNDLMEEGATAAGRRPVIVTFKREADSLQWTEYEPVEGQWEQLPILNNN